MDRLQTYKVEAVFTHRGRDSRICAPVRAIDGQDAIGQIEIFYGNVRPRARLSHATAYIEQAKAGGK